MANLTDSAFELVQSNFVMFSPDNVDPSNIPEHLRDYYDRAYAVYQEFRHFAGCRDIPANQWPLICLLAEQQRQIDELAEALGNGHAVSGLKETAGEAAAQVAAPRRGPGRPRKQEMTTDGR